MRLLERAFILLALVFAEPSRAAPPATEELPAITAMKGTGALVPPENPDRFTFVVFGDNRPAKGEPQPQTIVEIFGKIRTLEPAFALSLGDTIEGKPKSDSPAETSRLRKQFADFLGLAATASAPIFNAPGNHEMDDDGDVPSARMHELYRENVAPPYGAFDYGNSRFILLNTEDVPPPGTIPPPADAEFSYMSPQQLARLEADLEAHRDKAHVFVAMHYPLYALHQGRAGQKDDRLNPTDRKALSEMLARFDNVAYVLAAHEHLYYDAGAPGIVTDPPGWQPGNPTRYLVSGGAGAPLDPGKWGFHHYLVFTVDGDEVTVTLHKLKGTGASN